MSTLVRKWKAHTRSIKQSVATKSLEFTKEVDKVNLFQIKWFVFGKTRSEFQLDNGGGWACANHGNCGSVEWHFKTYLIVRISLIREKEKCICWHKQNSNLSITWHNSQNWRLFVWKTIKIIITQLVQQKLPSLGNGNDETLNEIPSMWISHKSIESSNRYRVNGKMFVDWLLNAII